MNEFKVGDLVKVKGDNIVFLTASLSKGLKITPDGWPIDIFGTARNPDMCELYEGATSVFEGIEDE